MLEQRIEPTKVTKPIQLLAAWLAGLVLVDGAFLGAASHISNPPWAAGALVVAAIVNVPLFLVCLFLLQTRFRPEMQEDSFYASYLEKRYSSQTARMELVEVAVPAGATAKAGVGEHPKKLPEGRVKLRKLEESWFQDTTIEINDLLPNYREIRSRLEEAGLEIHDTFGSTSGVPKDRPGPPNPFIVSICTGEIAAIQKIVRIASDFGLEGVEGDNSEGEEGVFIGSYSYQREGYVAISDKVLSAVASPSLNWPKLKKILAAVDQFPVTEQEKGKPTKALPKSSR